MAERFWIETLGCPKNQVDSEKLAGTLVADGLGVSEVVLVAQDLASYGRDVGDLGLGAIVPLVRAVSERVARTRLLYLYPSDLTDALIDAIADTGVPYFDLSLQHVSRPLLRRMRRWGDGERFLRRIDQIRARWPEATFRSNFIVGYPGETEADHDVLLRFVEQAQLDWCGFFAYSPEEGTLAAGLDAQVPPGLVAERLAELRERQDAITAARRDALIGRDVEVLVDAPGTGRTHREAPEIDGVVQLPETLAVGHVAPVRVVDALGPDLVALPAPLSAMGRPRCASRRRPARSQPGGGGRMPPRNGSLTGFIQRSGARRGKLPTTTRPSTSTTSASTVATPSYSSRIRSAIAARPAVASSSPGNTQVATSTRSSSSPSATPTPPTRGPSGGASECASWSSTL